MSSKQAPFSPAALGVGVALAVVAATVWFLTRKPKGIRVASVNELKPGEKKEVKLGEENILLVKTKKSTFHALGSKCTHFKASMAKGVLCGDRLVCPWHAACFNVTTGDIEDGPCLDPLPKYECFVQGDSVYVKPGGPVNAVRTVAQQIDDDQRQFVVIGGGPAGVAACQSFRDQGYTGKIVLITKENALPYDRTKMSKNLAITSAECQLRPDEFYSKYNINVQLGTTVQTIDTEKRFVHTDKGAFEYHNVLIATGGPARTFRAPEAFTIPGADLRNIFVLREATDAAAVSEALKAAVRRPQVVIVGSSFIGMEAAAYLVKLKTVDVTVIGMESEPFERVLGTKVGAFMRRLHESNGVRLMMKSVLKSFEGSGGAVTGVRLNTDQVLPADLVIIGAGIIPATGFLRDTRIPLEKDGSIKVNEFLSAAPYVFAAGDVAKFPYAYTTDGSAMDVRIEHWDVAYDMGRCAAQNILKKRIPYRNVPFFWTQQYGKSLRATGYAHRFDFEIIQGNMEGDAPAFTVYYMQRVAGSDVARAAAVATFNRDPYAVAAMELIRLGKLPDESVLAANPNLNLEEYLSTQA